MNTPPPMAGGAVDLSRLGKGDSPEDKLEIIMAMLESNSRAQNLQFAALCRLLNVKPLELVTLFKDDRENWKFLHDCLQVEKQLDKEYEERERYAAESRNPYHGHPEHAADGASVVGAPALYQLPAPVDGSNTEGSPLAAGATVQSNTNAPAPANSTGV